MRELSAEEVTRILDLVRQGNPKRAVARMTGVSRGVIAVVIRDPERAIKRRRVPLKKSHGITYPNMRAPYTWCDICTAWVRPPCLACQVRNLRRR
jgi:hypothetical protein